MKLTAAESELWGKYQEDRSVESRNKLVEHYFGLALTTAKVCLLRKGKGNDPELAEEVRSAVSESLIRSIQYFRFDRGSAPRTFLIFCMRQAAFKALRPPDVARNGIQMAENSEEFLEAKPENNWRAYHKIFSRLLWDLTVTEEKIFVMSFEFGMKPKAISRELNITITNADIQAIYDRLATLHTRESLLSIA